MSVLALVSVAFLVYVTRYAVETREIWAPYLEDGVYQSRAGGAK